MKVVFHRVGPEWRVTREWDGWWGQSALARYWEQRSWRWLETGRTLVSEWRWSEEEFRREPVQSQRARFWIVWSLEILEGEVLGNQTGAA